MRHNHVEDGVKIKTEKKLFSCDFKGCTFQADTIKGLKEHKSKHSKPWYLNRKFKCKWCDFVTVCQGGNSVELLDSM